MYIKTIVAIDKYTYYPRLRKSADYKAIHSHQYLWVAEKKPVFGME